MDWEVVSPARGLATCFRVDRCGAIYTRTRQSLRRPRAIHEVEPIGLASASSRSWGKDRPNRLGLCTCKILGVNGTMISVEGLDAVDGTPALDLMLVMREFLPREQVRQPDCATEIMSAYW